MYITYSHFATAEQIAQLNAWIHSDGRKVASGFGRALAINRWIVNLTNCNELEGPSKAVRWTYDNGVVYIYYWGNIWGWRTLKRRMEEIPSPGVTVTSFTDWEVPSSFLTELS